MFCFCYLGGLGENTFYVDYRTEDGSANAGSDYEYSEGTLVFKPGETRKEIKVSKERRERTFIRRGERSSRPQHFNQALDPDPFMRSGEVWEICGRHHKLNLKWHQESTA